MSEPLLSVRHIEVGYGQITAVRGASLEVRHGEIVALLGSNGAGKTSTLRAITGLVHPRAGRILLDGAPIHRASPARIVGSGLAHVPEGRRVFPGLSVDANLDLGAWQHRANAAERRTMVFDLFPRLAERRTQLAGSMSGGEQQMLAIGRALMADPRLLLIDELSLGLAPIIVDQLLEDLVALHREGLSIMLIEQFVHRALGVADRVYVMAKGHIEFSGTPAEAERTGAVESAYLSGSNR